MRFLDFPELNQSQLAEMSQWRIVRQAAGFVRDGAVRAVLWENHTLFGEVVEAGVTYEPELNLKSLTFVKCSCQCPTGRRGIPCAHAMALYLQQQRIVQESPTVAKVAQQTPASQKTATRATTSAAAATGAPAATNVGTAAEPVQEPTVRSLRLSESGEPLRLRLHIPPQLEDAIKRGSCVLRLEFVLGRQAVAPEKLFRGAAYCVGEGTERALALLEELCAGRIASLLQLKNAVLRQLLTHLATEGEYVEARGESSIAAAGFIQHVCQLMDAAQPQVQTPTRVPRRGDPIRRGVLPASPVRTIARTPVQRELWPDNWMIVDGSPKYLAIHLREREHPCYRGCVEWLRREGFVKEPSNGFWWLRDAHKVLNFLATQQRFMEETYDPGYLQGYRERMANVENVAINCQANPSGNGDYHLQVSLTAQGLSLDELRRALLAGRRYVIQEERIFLIEEAALERFAQSTRALGGDPNTLLTGLFQTRISAAAVVDAQKILDDMDGEVSLPEDWTQKSQAILQVGKLEPPPLPDAVARQFRSYQLIGSAWLWHLLRNGLGGVLADEMGLGKTIQAIGLLLCWQQDRAADEQVLIVVPASLIGNWQRELARWAPQLRIHIHHGQGRHSDADAHDDADVWLTSYATLRNDLEAVTDRNWALIIADEAQHIKNRRTRSARALRTLSAQARFVLTGTPIENSIEDLRSLFDFCLPGYLERIPPDTKGEERNWFERRHLEKAAPYILRRSKQLVAPELPEKIEQTLWCPLSPEQAQMYAEVQQKAERLMMELAAKGVSENRMRFTLLTELLRLRQVCADPGLLDPEMPLSASSKFGVFRELLAEAIDGGHRILVFSQFVKLLQRLRADLEDDGHTVSYIDGKTRDRLAVCDRFNNDTGIPVCLISLKAGGTGLNLTGADTVVHFDPWWNPAVEDQATDRAHRIGQTATVTSYKLVTEATVEEKVLALQMQKANLLRDLLDESAHQSAKVDMATLQSLLR